MCNYLSVSVFLLSLFDFYWSEPMIEHLKFYDILAENHSNCSLSFAFRNSGLSKPSSFLYNMNRLINFGCQTHTL